MEIKFALWVKDLGGKKKEKKTKTQVILSLSSLIEIHEVIAKY